MARAAVVAALLVLAASTAAAITAQGMPIRATPLRERHPVASGEYLAWAQGRRRSPAPLAVYARRGRGRPFRVSRRGVQAFPGAISGTRLVYQEFTDRRSDIRFYDLARRQHLRVPRGVNTRRWEWRPSLSGPWLVFSRHDDERETLFLYDLRSGQSTPIDSSVMRDGQNVIWAGQVNGNYLVWHRCPSDDVCNVVRYDLTTRLPTQIPAPLGRVHYAPSVTADGTVYLGRSAPRCGRAVELWRYPLSGPPSRLFALPRGVDFGFTYAVSGPSATAVYYERGRCTNANTVGASDLYRYTVRG